MRDADEPRPEPRWLESDAELSACGRYRYRLTRVWDRSRPRCLWVMLNPSTADERSLDPTARRCFDFSLSWGCGALEAVNLFALRSSDPGALYRNPPVDAPGEEGRNDRVILAAASPAWGRCTWSASPRTAPRATRSTCPPRPRRSSGSAVPRSGSGRG